jgi:drug/metabolite transporter (DMT)-like permease
MTWTRERPASGTIVALACACGGILLLLGGGLDATVRGGDLLSLACAFVFAVQIIALAEYSRRAPALALTGVTLAVTALLGAVGAAIAGERPPQPITRGAASLVYLGIVATALTIFAQTAGQRLTSANRAAFIFALEPAFAVLFAWMVRGHRLSPAELAGGALLVAAAIVADRRIELRRVRAD